MSSHNDVLIRIPPYVQIISFQETSQERQEVSHISKIQLYIYIQFLHVQLHHILHRCNQGLIMILEWKRWKINIQSPPTQNKYQWPTCNCGRFLLWLASKLKKWKLKLVVQELHVPSSQAQKYAVLKLVFENKIPGVGIF